MLQTPGNNKSADDEEGDDAESTGAPDVAKEVLYGGGVVPNDVLNDDRKGSDAADGVKEGPPFAGGKRLALFIWRGRIDQGFRPSYFDRFFVRSNMLFVCAFEDNPRIDEWR